LTGGQNLAQLPLHFEVVLVSGANQYSVSPLESVRTLTPPIVVVLTMLDVVLADWVLPPAPPDPAAGAPELPELPHPAAISPAAARLTGTSHLLLITVLRSLTSSPTTLTT